MEIISRPSPNFDERKRPIDMLIMHYTGMKTGEEAMERLCDPEAKVSAHYTVEEDGRVFQHVEENDRAWHAGVSSWKGEGDVNSRSIGIEIVNPGHEFGYRPFPDEQIASVTALSKEILSRHEIPASHVLGHSDVAPDRKEDPGELFPWQRLAGEGIGRWVQVKADTVDTKVIGPDAPHDAILQVQKLFADFGYGIRVDGKFGDETCAVVTAFQRHFVPNEIGKNLEGHVSATARATLERLLQST